jgi:anti-sigma regulatory factor (Ser/Thr protein kinase)
MTGESVEEAQGLLSAMAQGARWHDHRVAFIHSASQTMSVGLAAVPESVREARDFARSVLESWNLGAMFDDVRLVVSELVTNALRYAAPAEDAAPIRLSLLCTGARLTCAVTDPSDQIPVHKDPECTEQSGRGLQLVEAFSDSWNWAPLADRGKVVWACFVCPD